MLIRFCLANKLNFRSMDHYILPTLFSSESLQFTPVFIKNNIKNTGSARRALLNILLAGNRNQSLLCDAVCLLRLSQYFEFPSKFVKCFILFPT